MGVVPEMVPGIPVERGAEIRVVLFLACRACERMTWARRCVRSLLGGGATALLAGATGRGHLCGPLKAGGASV